jgi:hypothetical protein
MCIRANLKSTMRRIRIMAIGRILSSRKIVNLLCELMRSIKVNNVGNFNNENPYSFENTFGSRSMNSEYLKTKYNIQSNSSNLQYNNSGSEQRSRSSSHNYFNSYSNRPIKNSYFASKNNINMEHQSSMQNKEENDHFYVNTRKQNSRNNSRVMFLL